MDGILEPGKQIDSIKLESSSRPYQLRRLFILKTAIESTDYADFRRFSYGYLFFMPHPVGEQTIRHNMMIYLR